LGLAAESKENPLMVCGSFYLAGEVMKLLSD
jgi:folylpolyglutamate synthase/dihydropteroate synthase